MRKRKKKIKQAKNFFTMNVRLMGVPIVVRCLKKIQKALTEYLKEGKKE